MSFSLEVSRSLPSLHLVFGRCARRASRLRHRSLSSVRGFTLVELMVVVVIIAILSAIAVPSIAQRLRERRSQEAAERIAALYRGARMRAMGRGGAVFVRYNEGAFSVFEAVQTGGEAGCLVPFTGCSNPPSTATVTQFNIPKRAEYEGVVVAEGAGRTQLDVCYTPLGRAYVRGAPSDPLAPLGGVLSFNVNRGTAGGLTRTVTVLPNGVARMAARAGS